MYPSTFRKFGCPVFCRIKCLKKVNGHLFLTRPPAQVGWRLVFLCLRGENHGSGKKKFLWRAVAVFGIIMMDCQEGAIVRMIRAVAFDMDDTLLNNERQITPFTVSILRRVADQGIRIIPASGRAKASMDGFVEQIGCAAAFVACNGAEVYGPMGEMWHQELLSIEDARRCARFAQEAGCYAQCYYGDHFYYAGTEEWARSYAAASLLTGSEVKDLPAFIDRPTPKILIMAEPERVAELLPRAREQFADVAAVSCSKPYFLEMNPLRATKGNALVYLAQRWGLCPDEFMAFGDSLNDLSMLTWAGMGVAMENAREDVKRQVGRVCGVNENDGVARYMEALLL